MKGQHRVVEQAAATLHRSLSMCGTDSCIRITGCSPICAANSKCKHALWKNRSHSFLMRIAMMDVGNDNGVDKAAMSFFHLDA